MRKITEVHEFTTEDVDSILMGVAKAQIVGGFYCGEFGDQWVERLWFTHPRTSTSRLSATAGRPDPMPLRVIVHELYRALLPSSWRWEVEDIAGGVSRVVASTDTVEEAGLRAVTAARQRDPRLVRPSTYEFGAVGRIDERDVRVVRFSDAGVFVEFADEAGRFGITGALAYHPDDVRSSSVEP